MNRELRPLRGMVFAAVFSVGIWAIFIGVLFGALLVIGPALIWTGLWVRRGQRTAEPRRFVVPPYHERIAPDAPRRRTHV